METRKDVIMEYGQALLSIPQLLRRLAFRTRTLEEELHEAMLRGNLRKSFSGLDLLMLGLGVVIGTGVFVLTGEALAQYAGSAVFLSYGIAGTAAACAAACYAELCVEYPIAGSAFTYTMATFGELPAFVTLGMLVVEYVLGAAAVARGFSRYLALLTNHAPTFFLVPYGSGESLDYMACAVILVLSAALCFGVRESSAFLTGATLLKLAMLLTIVVVGFSTASGDTFADNFTLQPDPGADGVFQGAAFVFFTYTAFDAVCNAAEEVQNIAHVPGAILGTVGISGLIYMLMALSLSMMVSPAQLLACSPASGAVVDPSQAALEHQAPAPGGAGSCAPGAIRNYQLPFSYAFTISGLGGMRYFVALTALLGIITSLLVSLYSMARLVMVAARDWLLPPPLARISQRTQTPLLAQAVLGVIIAVVALLVSFVALSQLVSCGTLFAMWMVCNVLLFRRFYPDVKLRFTRHGTVEATEAMALRRVPGSRLSVPTRRVLVTLHLLAINVVSITFGGIYGGTLQRLATDAGSVAKSHDMALGVTSAALVASWLLVTLSMLLCCPLEYEPHSWHISRLLLPWLPSFAILLICFSVASLDPRVFSYMGYYLAGLVLFYVLYALPMSYLKHFKFDAERAEQLNVVELVYHDGKWTSLVAAASSPMRPGMTAEVSGLSSVRRYMYGPSYGSEAWKVRGGSDEDVSRSNDSASSGVVSPARQSSVWPLPVLQEEADENGVNK